MNITIISASETGGAGAAAQSLQKGFLQKGINAGFISEKKIMAEKKTPFARLRNWWLVRKYINRNAAYLKDAPVGYDHFSFCRTGYQDLQEHPLVQHADVINLHWVSYLIDYPTFFKELKKPVIWTLHDTNLFTGGCHYTYGCDNYLRECDNCPQLAPGVKEFAAKDNLKLKQASLANIHPAKMVVISPSVWLKTLSERSALFGRYKHYHIPNGIDTEIFTIADRAQSREQLNLPADKFIVLFVGTSLAEHRKGFDIILKLEEVLKERDDILFVAIGNSAQSYQGINNLGYISDTRVMATAYNAANVFVIPSRQDNLPNTMLESLCCGTPVIGYKTGGIVDAVEHGVNGFLADKENITDIAANITAMANKPGLFNRQQIAGAAKGKYALEKQALAYLNIINELIKE